MRAALTKPRTAALAVLSLVGSLGLAACAETGGSNSAGGEGVEAGATMEEYQEAFADIEPITLNTQSPAPKGSVTGANVEAYLAAIEEWSDGKVSFEIAYSNAVAPPAEIDDALRDGRLDLGQVLPIYEPSEYPATAALIEMGFISNQSAVVGALQSNAWPNEVFFDNEDVMQEWDDQGLVPMVPVYNSGSNGFFCSSEKRSLDEIEGAATGSGGTAQSAQVEALGGSPSSVPYTELFESLERGVVDCTVSSPTVSVLGGFIEEAPHVVIDPEAGFALAPGGMAFSKATWETLPLVVQQLFWDRLDIFIGQNITEKIWPNTVLAAEGAKSAGGSIETFEEDARAALQEENAELIEEIRSGDAFSDSAAVVDGAQESADRWLEEVEGLGFADEVGYNEFDTWYTPGEIDIQPFLDLLMQDVFADHRPS
ncbi:TRAP transporter substrate-binding protein DctP [Nocardioides zeae]